MRVPWRSPKLYVLLAITLTGIMGVAMLGPVLPTLRTVFSVSDTQVGLVFIAYTIPGIVLTPMVGIAADRVGRRPVLVPLLVLYGVAGAGIVLAPTFEHLLALRFAQGIGASGLITLSLTLVGDYYEGVTRSSVVSVNSSVIGVGAAVFPAIGGLLVALRWWAPFAFFGVSVIVAFAALAVLPEPAVDRQPSLRTYRRHLGEVRTRRVVGLYGATFVTYVLLYGGVLTSVPLVLTDSFALSPPEIGVLLALTSAASGVVASRNVWLATRVSVTTLLGTGFLAFGSAFVGIWFAESVTTIAGMLVVFGTGIGVTMPTIDRTLVGVVSSEQRASVMGVKSSTIWLGQTVGPVAFPLLATTITPSPTGYQPVFLAFGTIAATVGVLTLLDTGRSRLDSG